MKNEELLEKLKQDRDNAKKDMDVACEEITMQEYAYYEGPKMERQLKICVNIFDNVINLNDGTKTQGMVLHCENFRGSSPCLDSRCPYNKKNLEYAKAREKYLDTDFEYSNGLWTLAINEMKKKNVR